MEDLLKRHRRVVISSDHEEKNVKGGGTSDERAVV